MKYSQKLVWKAIYEFVPSYKEANEMGVTFNMPQCLNTAAVEIFLQIGMNAISSLGTNKSYAALIVQDALKELNQNSWLAFGTQEEYWGCPY